MAQTADNWTQRKVFWVFMGVEFSGMESKTRLCRNSGLRRSLLFLSSEFRIIFRQQIFVDFSKISDSQAIKFET